MKRKVLILSCNTGGGHNSAANAIKECFESHGTECDIFDTLALFSKGVSDAVSKGHIFVYRHLPQLFGATYRFEEKHNNKVLYYANASNADELYEYIVKNGYETVIAVHVFAELTLTEIRKKHSPGFKSYFVATDYTCSPGVNMGDMDAFFVPIGLKAEFVERGVPCDKIIESGIPVRKIFYETGDKKKAKVAEGLDINCKHILLMCGSMGAGPMEELTKELVERLPDKVSLTVVCGNNQKLFDSLQEYSSEKVRILGYSEKISSLMDASELLIGKPGGLSTSEALAKRLPMVCIDAVPGCETRNIDFLTRKGYILSASEPELIAKLALELLCDEIRLDHMKTLMERDLSKNAAEEIYSCVSEVFTRK